MRRKHIFHNGLVNLNEQSLGPELALEMLSIKSHTVQSEKPRNSPAFESLGSEAGTLLLTDC